MIRRLETAGVPAGQAYTGSVSGGRSAKKFMCDIADLHFFDETVNNATLTSIRANESNLRGRAWVCISITVSALSVLVVLLLTDQCG